MMESVNDIRIERVSDMNWVFKKVGGDVYE